MGWRKSKAEFEAELARLAGESDGFAEWFDRAANAALLDPGAEPPPELPAPPEIPAQRVPEQPRDIMGGSSA